MTRLPNNYPQGHQPQGAGVPPPPPPRRWRFRWGLWVGVPLTCLAAAWFFQGIERPAFEWGEVMRWLGVRQPERYTRLTVLAIGLIAVVAILRVIRDGKKDE